MRRGSEVQQRWGVALPPGARSVATPSRWGNPFGCGSTPEERAVAEQQYRDWLDGQHPEVRGCGAPALTGPGVKAAAVTELAGWDLACYCPLGGPCHRRPLLELMANGG